jgi:glycogen(starch) synthase
VSSSAWTVSTFPAGARLARVTHLFVCREYPPAPYPPGGIGTYTRYITDLLARSGETVHVIAHRWHGAPEAREERCEGRLIIHRVALDDVPRDDWSATSPRHARVVPRGLIDSSFPSQAFSWQAARLAENLVVSEGIDVIEAQDWEAPLYYFQLRRVLGLGPASRPPCVIHIHSPTERIFAGNGWDTGVVDYRPAAAFEEFSIESADAVLCPSRFVADEVLSRYRVSPARVSVIPYPLGDVPHIERTEETWRNGSICHVGRLEGRKGVIEWCEALAMVPEWDGPGRMIFIGGDTPLAATGGAGVGDAVRARLPPATARRVDFLGSRSRPELFGLLSQAWATVVPSRWDNFPYTCIEAMSTGLPVVASPSGGMRELIDDGVSGWIARDGSPAALADAFRRALATDSRQRARMGQEAEHTVRRICDNETVVSQHLRLKTSLRTGIQPVASAAAIGNVPRGPGNLALAITGAPDRTSTDIADAARQSISACALWTRREATRPFDLSSVLAVAFVDSHVHVEGPALNLALRAMESRGDVGLLSGWIHDTTSDRILVPVSPDAPFISAGPCRMPLLCIRSAAWADVMGDLASIPDDEVLTAAVTRILAAGWRAWTYPAVLGSLAVPRTSSSRGHGPGRYSSMARAVQRLHTPLLRWLLSCPPDERRAVLRQGLQNPSQLLWQVLSRIRHRAGIGPRADRARTA